MAANAINIKPFYIDELKTDLLHIISYSTKIYTEMCDAI